MRHRIEDSRLSEQHHQQDRAQAGQRACIHNVASPAHAGFANRQRNRSAHIQARIMYGSGQQERNQNVENGADHQRAENSDGHIALRIPGFLRSR